MRQESKPARVLWWWLVPVLLLWLLDQPVLSLVGVFVEVMLPLTIVVLAAAFAGRVGTALGWGQAPDPLALEEAGRRQRLAALRTQADQMQTTLRDLRVLRLPGPESSRAQWAEIDLEQALRNTRQAMARERASLFMVETLRWLAQIEPLVQNLDRLDEPGTRHWLGRLAPMRAQGVELLTRVRCDLEAAQTPSGRATESLLGEALGEMDALRGDLLAHRARLLARTPLPEDARGEAETATLERLRVVLHSARARREVNGWMEEEA